MGVRFILELRIRLLRQGRNINPSRILFGFKWRKTSSRVTPHKGSMACHSTMRGRGFWWKSLGAKIARDRWVRARGERRWITVPLQSGRLQRVALYALNCDQKCMSSSMTALATMRYSFSFFTYFGFFSCLLISLHFLVCFHHL